MFNSICLQGRHTDNPNRPIDLGFLAETMLFYNNIHLVVDNVALEQLISYCGVQLIWEIIGEGFLTINYLDDGIGIAQIEPSKQIYAPMSFTSPSWKLEEAVSSTLQKISGKHEQNRKLSSRLVEHIHPVNISGKEIVNGVSEDFAHKEYVKKAAIQILQVLAPEYKVPPNFKFDIESIGRSFKIDSNLDFVQTNKDLFLRTPTGITSISPDTFLMLMAEAKKELHISCLYNGEIATSPFLAALIQIKCQELINAHIKSKKNIGHFQDITLDNSYAIREAINSNERNYRDLLQLLRKARKLKFQYWLDKAEPDIDLIKAYYKEMTTDTWTEKLPAKALRWVILTGLGIALLPTNPFISTAISGGVSLVDSFVVDKIAQGWKPNHFVEKHLKPFVGYS